MDCTETFNLVFFSIILVKYDGTIYFSNTAANELFGYSDAELIGKKVEVLIPNVLCQRHIKVRKDYTEKLSTRVMSPSKRFTVLRKDKSTFHAAIGLTPIFNDGMKLISVAITDVSEIEQQAHAERMNQVGEMAMGIAHNFNNYLTGIKGQVYQLKKSNIEPNELKRLDTIDSLCDQSGKIVKDLLIYGHVDSASDEKFDLSVTLNKVKEIISPSLSNNIYFQLIIENEPIYILGNEAQIEQVLLNMVNNSIHAIGDSKSEIVIICRQCTNSNMICIKVRDTGHGITKENIQKIFNPFFTTKAAGEGTGLGLSTSISTIEKHGGKLSVSSKINEGTCFQFYLPRSLSDLG